MNTHTLIHLIQSPEEVKESHVEMLEEEIAHHPYFQAVRVLIAKAKGDSSSIKKAAAYTADRGVLMKIINSDFNPDVNLPNIDHLDIQKDDINAFERLANEDSGEGESDFKATLEALAEGDEEPAMTKDPDFDSEFGDIDFNVPAYQVDFEEGEEEESTPATNIYNSENAEESGYEQAQKATNDTVTSDIEEEMPLMWPSEEENDEDTNLSEVTDDNTFSSAPSSLEENLRPEEEDEGSIDADLLANIEAARKSRELFMNDDIGEAKEEEQQEAITEPLPITKEEELIFESDTHNPNIVDEEDVEVNDPDLLASLAELRQAKAEAMRIKDEAEQRMADMDEDIDETIEAIVRDEYPQDNTIKEEESDLYSAMEGQDSEETIFEEPSYPDPFEESAAIIEKKSDTTSTKEQTEVIPPSSTEDLQTEKRVEEEDNFGIDSSLFGLDNWLEEEEEETTNQPSKTPPPVLKKTAPQAQNRHIEHNYTEEDGMTLEDKIKTQSNIISSFMEKKPKIRPDKSDLENLENDKDLSEESIAQTPTFVSENLASIMVRQGKYGQAINIYKQLILKYPDKKAYFADLIENLENK